MSEFSDFMTMKLIEQRRFEKKGMSDNLSDNIIESLNMNRNLNVRTKVDLISRIEVLADFFNLSKAELVTEMLESSVLEALKMIEKEGWLDAYLKAHFKKMESEYGFIPTEYDENGMPSRFKFPESDKKQK